MGGFKGSHAEYVRIPYADQVAFQIPDGVDDMTALFASDSAPTGWMGADLAGAIRRRGRRLGLRRGRPDGGPGGHAAGGRAGDRYRPLRLPAPDGRARGRARCSTTSAPTSTPSSERSGGRGPDVCIEAIGMEAHTPGLTYRFEQAGSSCGWRPTGLTRCARPFRPAARPALCSCSESSPGWSTSSPGALMNKGLTLRSAQQHGERYIPMLLERMAGASSRRPTWPPTPCRWTRAPRLRPVQEQEGRLRPLGVPAPTRRAARALGGAGVPPWWWPASSPLAQGLGGPPPAAGQFRSCLGQRSRDHHGHNRTEHPCS